MKAGKIGKYTFLAIIALLIITPLIPLAIWSFAEYWQYPGLLPEQFTFDHYTMLFDAYDMANVIWQSIKLSFIVMLISLILAIAPAKYIGTHYFRGKALVQTVTMMPFMAPAILVLFGLLPVYAKLRMYMTYTSLIATEVIFMVPYMIMVLVPVFKNYDPTIEDQAATLGITSLSRLMNVVLPTVRSGLIVGCMYVFMASWATYLAVVMYAPAGFNTVATVLYPSITSGQFHPGFTAALTIIFFLPSVFFLFISTWVMGTDRVNNQRV